MAGKPSSDRRVTVTASNIGGIDDETVELTPGVTALVGENATNRSSLIQAIAAGLGSNEFTLKSDADSGHVSATIDGERYERSIQRDGEHVRTTGDPYLTDPTVADLFAILGRSNSIRRAVRTGADIGELIMEPVDTDEIERRIADCVDERREVDAELDHLDALEDELTEHVADRKRMEATLATIDEELTEKRERLESVDGGQSDHADAGPDFEQRLERKLSSLRETHSELERVENSLETERKRLDTLRESRATVQSQRDSLTVPDPGEIERLEQRVQSLREQKRQLESTVTELQQVVQFNENRLAGSGDSFETALEDDGPTSSELVPNAATTTCWTCGTQVERSQIDEMLDQLQSIRDEKVKSKQQIKSEIDAVETELNKHRAKRDEHTQLTAKLDSFQEQIEDGEDTVAEFEERREALQTRATELEAAVESLQTSQQDELLELQEAVSELSVRREEVAANIETTASKIDSIEDKLETRTELEARREELSTELTELRTRVETVQRDALEAFNTHIAALVDQLGYDNIDRIWMERAQSQTAGQPDESAAFRLHVVRQTADGKAYEDHIDHLSESERELVGLVAALAGYLVHDVHEEVPFMLLDSAEMIDGTRLAELVSYLDEFVPYLVIVLLPEHETAFDNHGTPDSFTAVHV